MVYSINPTGLSQYYSNNFATQSLLGQDDLFMGLGPVGQDSPNIFGAYTGGIAGGYPGAFGASPFGGYMDPKMMGQYQEQMMENQARLQDKMTDMQVHKHHKQASAEFKVTSNDNNITRQIATLQRKIRENEQDHVISEYNKLVAAVGAKLKNGGSISVIPDENSPQRRLVQAEAERLYQEATGSSVTEDLTKYGDSPVWHGIKQGLSFGLLTNKKGYEENISEITGEQVSKSVAAWKTVGNVVGGLAGGLAAFIGIRHGVPAAIKGVGKLFGLVR